MVRSTPGGCGRSLTPGTLRTCERFTLAEGSCIDVATTSGRPAKVTKAIPDTPIDRWLAPVHRFLQVEASSGIVLMVCATLALVLANSRASTWFLSLWHEPFQIGLGDWVLRKDLLHVINDGLMAIFFFVVGLEIKREIVAGELRDPRQAALPIVAALGGMLVPALLFLTLNSLLGLGPDTRRGWAVPMATDIAFVVGVLALFGKRVPLSLKVMLLSVAIVDDLGAVLVIAIVFTDQIASSALAVAAGGFVLTFGLNRAGVRSVPVYVAVGAGIWLAVLKSGVHPTIAGVLLGLLTPHRAWLGHDALREVVGDLPERLRTEQPADAEGLQSELAWANLAVRESISPLARLEHTLHPWVAFLIMPVFALANAGVPIRPASASDPLAVVIAAGLLIGKPVGIVAFSFVAIRLRIARLPAGTNWMMTLGGGALAGIGFTMAIFLATLSLPADKIEAGKLGILLGSLLSACVGAILLAASHRARRS